jgi:dihydrolipoamide dehydrogenase
LGSTEVTIIEAQPNLLATYESFAGEILGKVFEDRFGIRVLTSKRATEVRRQGDEVTVTLDDGSTVSGDEILVAVGRRARTDDLGAETVGLEPGRPIEVNDCRPWPCMTAGSTPWAT